MQRDARADRISSARTALFAAFWGLALLAVMAVAPGRAEAQDNSAFIVRDVQVTKTAASGQAAQQAAIRDARDQALAYLFRRLTPESYHNALPRLQPGQVDSMVIATDIQEEQITATAYSGTMALTFSPNAVRAALASRNIPYTDQVSPPLIVVPVLERAGALQLWETPNAWDNAWRQRVGAQGLVQTVMAAGDPAEQLIISADQALAGDSARLQTLARNYGARGALVAHAKFRINPQNGRPALDATLTGFGAAPPGPLTRTFVGSSGLTAGADQAVEDLSQAAAEGLMEMLAAAWKAQNLRTATAPSDEILAAARLTHLGQYASMIRQLKEIPAVAGVSLAKLTADEAVFRLQLRGSPAEAQGVFSQYGLSLSQTPDGWRLHGGG